MSIEIEKRGRRVEVRSPNSLPGFRTVVPGAYKTTKGYWTIPLSLEACKLLQARYGRALRVGPELRRWATGVQQNRAQMASLARKSKARLEVLPRAAPKLYKAMKDRPYQLVGARFVADNPASLIADDPGLGKTLIAMGGIIEARLPGPYLVVCPKTAADSVWRREILRWLPDNHRVVTLPEIRYQREYRLRTTTYGPRTWVIVHPEIIMTQEWFICRCGKRTQAGYKQATELSCGHRKDGSTKRKMEHSYPKLFEIQWGAIIADESHEILIRRSGKPTQRRRGAEKLTLRSDGIKIAMSGSPFDSKPELLWGTLNWLDPVGYSAYHRWAEMYWRKGGYTGFEIGEFIKEREKMLWESLDGVALRRTKQEVAKDLPPKIYVGSPLIPQDENSPVGIWLPMDGKQLAAYEEMEAQSWADLDSGRLEAVTALAELTRLKQMACCYGELEERRVNGEWQEFYRPILPSNKFDWLTENMEEWGFPKHPIGKLVIVSFYSEILRCFARGINKQFRRKLCTGITGRTPSHLRRGIIDAFNQRGGPQVMMLNVKAGGSAITLDRAEQMVFISQTRNPLSREGQAEDRIHRVSKPRQCMYYYLNSLGTVDVGTAIDNEEVRRGSHRVLDGRRGVEYMRRVMELSATKPK